MSTMCRQFSVIPKKYTRQPNTVGIEVLPTIRTQSVTPHWRAYWSERSQGLIADLRTKCIEREITNAWLMSIGEEVLFANIKDARIHGFTPGLSPHLPRIKENSTKTRHRWGISSYQSIDTIQKETGSTTTFWQSAYVLRQIRLKLDSEVAKQPFRRLGSPGPSWQGVQGNGRSNGLGGGSQRHQEGLDHVSLLFITSDLDYRSIMGERMCQVTILLHRMLMNRQRIPQSTSCNFCLASVSSRISV